MHLLDNMLWIKFKLSNQLNNMMQILDKENLQIVKMILILICLSMKNIYKNIKKNKKIFYILMIIMNKKIVLKKVNSN